MKLARIGQIKESFIKYFFLYDKAPDMPYMDFVTSDYDSIHKTAMMGAMPEMAERMMAIYDLDQQCREGSHTDSELLACDREVREKLYSLIDEHGFPGPQNVGLFETITIQATNLGPFDFMLWHCRGYSNERIFDIALENVNKGLYDARRFSIGYFYYGAEYQITIPYEPVTRDELKQMNEKRAEIYLEPIEDYHRKVAFHTTAEGEYTRGYICFMDQMICMLSPMSTPIIIKD